MLWKVTSNAPPTREFGSEGKCRLQLPRHGHGFRRLFFLLLNFTGNILIYCLWWKKSNSPVEVGSLLLCFARSDFFHLRWFQIFLESPRFLGKMISHFWFHPLLENVVERSNWSWRSQIWIPTFCGKNTNLIYQSPKSIFPLKNPREKRLRQIRKQFEAKDGHHCMWHVPMDIWKYYDSCWRCSFSADFFESKCHRNDDPKKGHGFWSAYPSFQYLGVSNNSWFLSWNLGKMIKNLKSIFFRLVGATAAMLSLCYVFKDWNPKNQRLCSPRRSQVSFWIIYIWWEWLKRVGWDVVLVLFLFQNNMEVVEFRWCLPKWFFMVPLEFFGGHQLISPVNPANHTSWMRGSAGMNPSTYPTGFRAPFLYQAWSCFFNDFLHILPMGSFSPQKKSPFLYVNVHFTWFKHRTTSQI